MSGLLPKSPLKTYFDVTPPFNNLLFPFNRITFRENYLPLFFIRFCFEVSKISISLILFFIFGGGCGILARL